MSLWIVIASATASEGGLVGADIAGNFYEEIELERIRVEL